jgi:hypothetical protein
MACGTTVDSMSASLPNVMGFGFSSSGEMSLSFR